MPAASYRVVLHRDALAELKRLPKALRERARAVIDNLATNPIPPQAARIHGRAGAYRIRLDAYRMIYEVHATELVIYVIGVAHRREVYRRILRRR